ncbi:MAG: hypothetical protein ACRDOS_03525 [Gaiellaceae bacterium]
MTLCRVCGRAFDPSGFQVVVPGLGQGFDRVECAEIALARGVAPAAPPAAPLPAVVKPFPAPALGAAAAPVAAVLDRRPFLLGANVALLAAGTAVTVYLWLRVFGADPSSSLSLPAESGTPAWERATVPSQIDLGRPDSGAQGRNAGPAGGSGTAPAEGDAEATPSTGPAPVLVSNPSPRSPSPTGGGGDGPAGGGGGGGGGSDPQSPEPPKPPAPSPPDTPGKCEDDVDCDNLDDDEDDDDEDDDTSDRSRDASARARDGDHSTRADSDDRDQSKHDSSSGDKSKHDSSSGDKTNDKSKHEKDHTRAHESGNGKKKGHGKHH